MSQYIKSCAVSMDKIIVDENQKLQTTVDCVKNYWLKRIKEIFYDKPDIVVLPEVCDRPLFSNTKILIDYYKQRGNQIRDFFKEIAFENNCHIAFSSVRETFDEKFINSTQIIDRFGEIVGIYDKCFPVENETENMNIIFGDEANTIDCEFGSIGCAICFDLNFDELRQVYMKKRPNMILFSSLFHGGYKSVYWAYDTRAYFIGAIGCDKESYIISPVGKVLARSTKRFKFVTHDINLDYGVVHLGSNMKKFDKAKMKYGSNIKLESLDEIGAVLLTSETKEFSAKEVIEEFDITMLDDYYEFIKKNRRDGLGHGKT